MTEPLAEKGLELLREKAQTDVRLGLSTEELVKLIGDYEALIVRSQTKVTAEVIEAGRKLVVIGRAGVGLDNIDVDAATRKGIVVVNSPMGNIVATAEHTIALMFALARHIPQACASVKAGGWERRKFVGVELRGKVLGIIGLGRVGSEVARRARALEMKVIGYDPFISPERAQSLGVELVSWEELFRRADFISLHVPLTPSTRNLIGERELSWVKPTVRIINTARGGLIDEEALCRALKEGRVAGVALDVFSSEPPIDSSFLKFENVIATPHIGASTAEAQEIVGIDIANQVLSILEGKLSPYTVNLPFIPADSLELLGPFVRMAPLIGKIAAQLSRGQAQSILIRYEGEIASSDLRALKAAVLSGLLEQISEEKVNLVNAELLARERGLQVTEQKSMSCENYGNLLTVELFTTEERAVVAGTIMRGEPHVVKVGEFWVDFIPSPGYWLFIDHRDRPGLIGAVGTITGEAGIDISFMQVARLAPGGKALMVLGLDDPLSEEDRRRIEAIPDIYAARAVRI